MSSPWIPGHQDQHAVRAGLQDLGADPRDNLLAFPPEAVDGPKAADGHPKRTGITMRITTISPRLAMGLATILLLGLGGAIAIGVLANQDIDAPPIVSVVSHQP